MDDKIQIVPDLGQFAEGRVDRGLAADIAVHQRRRIHGRDQRRDALLENIALIGKGQFGARLVQDLGHAPGDGAVIGNAHDQAALALHRPFERHVPVTP